MSAGRLRESTAAYTSQQPVITINNAMRRSGVVSEAASTLGAVRTPNAAFPMPLACVAGPAVLGRQPGGVAGLGGQQATPLWSHEGLTRHDP